MNAGVVAEEIRVLVVDDSAFFRRMIQRAVTEVAGARVVATAENGRVALERLGQEPVDLVILDVEMPEMNGIETLTAIAERFPMVGVVMLTAWSQAAARVTVEALELGALDFLTKGNDPDAARNRSELVAQLKGVVKTFEHRRITALESRRRRAASLLPGTPTAAANAKGERLSDSSQTGSERAQESSGRPSTVVSRSESPVSVTAPRIGPLPRIDVVVIGSSTGGPQALRQVLPQLPDTLQVPVLVVQHMPPVFTASLAQNLDRASPLGVREAAEGDAVEPGTVLVAPGGRHMTVRTARDVRGYMRREIHLSDDPPENSCRPAVDVLLWSVAREYEGHSLVVVLTGMGEDGARGVKELKLGGCYCITQSAETCAVYGMPRTVDRMGLTDESVPLARIGARIAALVEQSRNTRIQVNDKQAR